MKNTKYKRKSTDWILWNDFLFAFADEKIPFIKLKKKEAKNEKLKKEIIESILCVTPASYKMAEYSERKKREEFLCQSNGFLFQH